MVHMPVETLKVSDEIQAAEAGIRAAQIEANVKKLQWILGICPAEPLSDNVHGQDLPGAITELIDEFGITSQPDEEFGPVVCFETARHALTLHPAWQGRYNALAIDEDGCTADDFSADSNFVDLRELRSLEITGSWGYNQKRMALGDNFANALQQFTKLERLSINGVTMGSVALSALLPKLPALKVLKIEATGIDDSLTGIHSLQNLVEIDTGYNRNVGNQVVAQLRQLPNLRQVDLWEAHGLTDACQDDIAALAAQVNTLQLSYSSIAGRGWLNEIAQQNPGTISAEWGEGTD